jgi:chromosome segregation ATPase
LRFMFSSHFAETVLANPTSSTLSASCSVSPTSPQYAPAPLPLEAVLTLLSLQVRASNLLDLIYKRGQAGITRASVTIVFDNSNKELAPVGFENMPEISVTRQVRLPFSHSVESPTEAFFLQISVNGQSKYLICGHRSTQQAVQNLFQSVQLNINNPNFLIMQGPLLSLRL